MIDADLLKYNLQDKKFIIYDFEGDLNLFYSDPFQLAYAVYNGKNKVKEVSTYIKWPIFTTSKKVVDYTKVDPKRVESEGKEPKEVFEEFGKYMNDDQYLKVGHNTLAFDSMVYYNCMKRLGLEYSYSFLKKSYDTNAIFKGMKLGVKPNYDNFLAWQYSMNSIVQKGLKSNVGVCAKEFNIEIDEKLQHDAGYDISKEWEIFLNIVDRVNIK